MTPAKLEKIKNVTQASDRVTLVHDFARAVNLAVKNLSNLTNQPK